MGPSFDLKAGYEILAELGRGTSGAVFKARHTKSNRIVALKLLVVAYESERLERSTRFMREAQALAALTVKDDANIPTIHEVGMHQEQPYYVREFVEGSTLEQLVPSSSVSLVEGVRILSVIARTIHRVHGQSFAHRNLHPSNVLVAADGTPKLIGFGRVGWLQKSELLPPERPRMLVEADLQGLGGLLTWFCSGLRQPIPAHLEVIARRCCTPGPTEGYSSADALADHLARCVQ